MSDSDSNDEQPLASFCKFEPVDNESLPVALTTAQLVDLPLSRVKTIMLSGGEQVAISGEGLYAMTKATELFISKLTAETYKMSDQPKCLEYSHFADYIQENDRLEFLHEMVPRMVRFGDVAEKLRKNGDSTKF